MRSREFHQRADVRAFDRALRQHAFKRLRRLTFARPKGCRRLSDSASGCGERRHADAANFNTGRQ